MEHSEIAALLNKYREGEASAEEAAWVESWYLSEGEKAPDFEGLIDYDAKGTKMWLHIQQQQTSKLPARVRLWPRIAVAAAILVFISAGLFIFRPWETKTYPTELAEAGIKPGENKAYLTLSDGRKISLNDAANGDLAEQEGISIRKTKDGQLIYILSSDQQPSTLNSYNTIETPKGGQYQVQLPDGTKVWLNAASSLRYPVSFAGLKERNVALAGEGYFEVAKDASHPFRVKAGINSSREQEIKVLGTHFNISSYADDPESKTTLLEGSISLSTKGEKLILKPGQQAVLNQQKPIQLQEVDASETSAWKDNKFIFTDEDIATIMRKVARWYNVEVDYESLPEYNSFSGSISRFENIDQVLRKIAMTEKVHFKTEGRRIIVMK